MVMSWLQLFVLTLVLIPAGLAATATEDNFRITAPDVVCTGTTCEVQAEICNDDTITQTFDVEVTVDKLAPVAFKEFTSVTTYQEQLVYNRTIETVLLENGTNYTVEHNYDYYITVPTTSDEWTLPEDAMVTFSIKAWGTDNELLDEDLVTNSGGANIRQVAKAVNTTFSPNECKQYKVQLVNSIGKVWKYDVNFLDPFINSTQYEIGNVTNSSNTWNIDMNSTQSNVLLSADSKSFSLGSVSGTLVDNDGSVDDTNNFGSSAPLGIGENFTINTPASIDQICIKGSRGLSYAGGTVELKIRTNSAGSPANGQIWGQNFSVSLLPAWTASPSMQCVFTPTVSPALNTSTTYWLTAKIINGSTTQEMAWSTDSTSPAYIPGVYYSSGSLFATHDANFRLKGYSDFNVSANYYESKPVSIAEEASSFTPTWRFVANGGNVTINATCNADEASPSWTGSLTNNSIVSCPADGDVFKYTISLGGNVTSSPSMQNMTVTFGFIADEEAGRTAILEGIANSEASSDAVSYADQQVVVRFANGTQVQSRVDYFIVAGDKRYVFNYNQTLSGSFPRLNNITPTLYVWQMYELSESAITSQITALIDSTY